MIINFGNKYYLNCTIENGTPSIKLEGEFYTINYSSSNNEEFTYLNNGFLAFKLLDFTSNIVLKNYTNFIAENDYEILISFLDSNYKLISVYFNLKSGEIDYLVE